MKLKELKESIKRLMDGIYIDEPIKLSEFFEENSIPHYYCCDSGCVPVGFDSSIKETGRMIFVVEAGPDVKSYIRLEIKK